MSEFIEVFSYPFAIRAFVVGILISLCAALLGVSLVLKRLSMLGDGLSHVAFGSAAIALAAGVAPLKISIPIVIAAAFLLLRISESAKIKGDAAIAVVSSSALAIGVIVATITTGMNTDINNYMFGSILAMKREDIWISLGVAIVIITVYFCFYNKIFACTFDENFAASCGVKNKVYNSLLAILTAVTVVIGMRMMGALLISSIITFPALSAMRVCKRYFTTVVCSGLISCVCVSGGLLLSFAYDMPAGASIVVSNLLVFLLFLSISAVRSRR